MHLLVTYKMFIMISVLKMMTSSKATVTMISVEFVSASLISALLILNGNVSVSITVTVTLLSMFVCEGVLVLSLLIYPVLHSGPTPRMLSMSLY